MLRFAARCLPLPACRWWLLLLQLVRLLACSDGWWCLWSAILSSGNGDGTQAIAAQCNGRHRQALPSPSPSPWPACLPAYLTLIQTHSGSLHWALTSRLALAGCFVADTAKDSGSHWKVDPLAGSQAMLNAMASVCVSVCKAARRDWRNWQEYTKWWWWCQKTPAGLTLSQGCQMNEQRRGRLLLLPAQCLWCALDSQWCARFQPHQTDQETESEKERVLSAPS